MVRLFGLFHTPRKGTSEGKFSHKNREGRPHSLERNEDDGPDIIESVPSATPSTPTTIAPANSGLTETPPPNDPHTRSSYQRYGLNSPPKGPMAVSERKAKKAIKQDGMKRFLKNEKTKAAIAFLYGKGFLANKSRKERTKAVRAMLEDKNESSKTKRRSKGGYPEEDERQPLDRLLQIVSAEGDIDTFSQNHELYKNVRKTYELYLQKEESVGFLQASEATLFVRHQKDGNCFLQAPCVLAAYWQQKHGLAEGAPVDVSKFIRHSFTDDQLIEYVIENNGGDSIDVLKKILSQKINTFEASELEPRPELIEEFLSGNGAGLVSSFKVDSKFANAIAKSKLGYVQFRERRTTRGLAQINYSPKNEKETGSSSSYDGDRHKERITNDGSKVVEETHAMILIAARLAPLAKLMGGYASGRSLFGLFGCLRCFYQFSYLCTPTSRQDLTPIERPGVVRSQRSKSCRVQQCRSSGNMWPGRMFLH